MAGETAAIDGFSGVAELLPASRQIDGRGDTGGPYRDLPAGIAGATAFPVASAIAGAFQEGVELLSEELRPGRSHHRIGASARAENGSRIVSLPGKQDTVRGFSGVRLLVVDEAARVSNDLYLSVRPMLAVSGGRLLALSTPFGTRGWWYDAWRSEERWERYEIPAQKCPRISPEFLEEERRAMGGWWFAQEYECRFCEAESQPFSRQDIERAFEEKVEQWVL